MGDCSKATPSEDIVKIRMTITSTSGIGMLIGGAILVVLISAKAYKSFLQRLMMWLVFTVFLHDLCRASSIFYEFYHGNIVLQLLQDEGCIILGFVTIWTFWVIYMLVIILIVYLVAIVCIQTREDYAIVARVKNSKLMRTLLESTIILGTLAGSLVILWVPYYRKQYGFDGAKCGLKLSNNSALCSEDTIVTTFFNIAGIELTCVASLLAALILMVVYYTIPNGLQHIKKLIKNLVLFLLGVFVYVMAYNVLMLILRYAKSGYQLSIFSICSSVTGKFVLIIGYLAVFHFSKKLIQNNEPGLLHNRNREYGALRETEPTPDTFFEVPYTGQFTTIQ